MSTVYFDVYYFCIEATRVRSACFSYLIDSTTEYAGVVVMTGIDCPLARAVFISGSINRTVGIKRDAIDVEAVARIDRQRSSPPFLHSPQALAKASIRSGISAATSSSR